jgi:hypothetical protein
MSWVVGLPSNSYKLITKMEWVRARLCKLKKSVHTTGSHKWLSPGTPSSSTTKTGRHDIAEILLKVALSTINQIIIKLCSSWLSLAMQCVVHIKYALHYYHVAYKMLFLSIT